MQDNYFYENDNLGGVSQGNYQESSSKDIPKIRVVVRKRPLNKKELSKNDLDIIELRGPQKIIVKELK
jgi:hypothetical protein